MSTLIVHLPPAGTGPAGNHRYVLTPDGHAIGQQGSVPATLLPQPSRSGGETVAVVPARMLSWQRVDLPKGSTASPARLRAVLDGLLEDRLLDDPQTLHFALESGPRGTGALWVAVCDRAWLRTAVQTLEAAGRPVSRIVPEFAPLPDGPALPLPEVHAIGTPDDPVLVVRGNPVAGLPSAVTVLPLSAGALALAGIAAHDDSPASEAPVLRAEPAVAVLAELLIGRPAVLLTSAERWVEAARSRWDLAQFDLASSSRARAFKKASTFGGGLLRAPQWRAARWGVAALLAAHIVGLNAWAWQEERALGAKKARIDATLRQTFPGVQTVVDVPLQMERELVALRQATGATSAGDLEAMLAALARSLPTGSAAASRIDYASGEARVQGLPTAPDAVAALAGQMRALGYAARSDGSVLIVRAEAGVP